MCRKHRGGARLREQPSQVVERTLRVDFKEAEERRRIRIVRQVPHRRKGGELRRSRGSPEQAYRIAEATQHCLGSPRPCFRCSRSIRKSGKISHQKSPAFSRTSRRRERVSARQVKLPALFHRGAPTFEEGGGAQQERVGETVERRVGSVRGRAHSDGSPDEQDEDRDLGGGRGPRRQVVERREHLQTPSAFQLGAIFPACGEGAGHSGDNAPRLPGRQPL
mmetsp:Transcript_1443/g.3122  ORF Transcript_1443/g.3122 Transcript_1443/m.3122 type:complete len:221 (+) Transcript_1443:457-1119(+)